MDILGKSGNRFIHCSLFLMGKNCFESWSFQNSNSSQEWIKFNTQGLTVIHLIRTLVEQWIFTVVYEGTFLQLRKQVLNIKLSSLNLEYDDNVEFCSISLTIVSCVTVNGLDHLWSLPGLYLLVEWHSPGWKLWLWEGQEAEGNKAGRKWAAGGPICRQRSCGGNIHSPWFSVCCSAGASLSCAPAPHSVWMSLLCHVLRSSLTQATAVLCVFYTTVSLHLTYMLSYQC